MANFLRRLTPWQASLLLVVFASVLRLAASINVGLGTDEALRAVRFASGQQLLRNHPR